MEDIVIVQPSVCFEVQKIIGVSIGNGNARNYQVQWAPTWVSGFHLVGCKHLIEAFVQRESEKNQFVEATTITGVTDTDDVGNDLQHDLRENILKDNESTSRHLSAEQASIVVNDERFLDNQESSTCLYSNISNDNANVKVETIMETNVSNEEICTSDMDASNLANSNFQQIKVEIHDNEDTTESIHNTTANDYGQQGGTSFSNQQFRLESENEFQNNVFQVKRREALEEESETGESSFNTDYKHYNVTEDIQSPTGKMVHTCMECDKTFVNKYKFNLHSRVHTGDKPFACKECNKAFARNDTLTTHMRLHTGEKPYKCSQCYKLFSDKSYYRRHLQGCKGVTHTCMQCDKTFINSYKLKRHLQVHAGHEPFACKE